MKKIARAVALGWALVACSGSGTSTSPAAGNPSPAHGAVPPAAAGSHTLGLDVTLHADGGEVSFLSPSNAVVKVPVSQIAGKPYLIATYHAGFSAGNDPAIDHAWGTLPESLQVHYETPATYADGAYDIVFVGYLATPITPAILSTPVQSAPPAKGGDLASFTLDSSAVLPADPKNALGTIRLNVQHANASVALENRVPADPSNAAQATAAFANTILSIP